MNSQLVIESSSSRAAATPLARLGANHSYRFDGDHVRLSAMFTVLDNAAHARAWALQLWACPQAPASANDLLSGHLVAEAPLPPIGEIADDTHGFEVNPFACVPAAAGCHAMVLVLAAARNGRYDDVQDLAVYPSHQHFLQPRMRGNARYRIEDNRVQISVDHIENARSADNVSGTLSLELWALTAPYAGGSFDGVSIAGTTLGPISGQHEATVREFDLAFTPPGAGTWHFTLMLREWTTAGFVTRDFVSFIPTVTYAPTPTPAPGASTAVDVTPASISTPSMAGAAAASVATKTITPAGGSTVESPVGAKVPPAASTPATRPIPTAAGTSEAQKESSQRSSKTVPADSTSPQASTAKRLPVNTTEGIAKAAHATSRTVSKAATAHATSSTARTAKTAEPKKKSAGRVSKTVSVTPASAMNETTAKGLSSKSRKA